MAIKIGINGLTYPDGTSQQTKYTETEDRGKFISVANFTSNGTWTKPAGCTKVRVICVGGGGGGSGYNESGGGGGYAEKWVDVTSISTVSVTVGGGGGYTNYSSAGGDGGTSSFGSYVSATGGRGANRNWGHTGGIGGHGSGGDINLAGGGGTGHKHNWNSGNPGSSYFGGGSVGRHASNHANGFDSELAPGAGGNGSAHSYSRGISGMTGAVIVWAFV